MLCFIMAVVAAAYAPANWLRVRSGDCASLHSDSPLSLLSLQAQRHEGLNMWAPTMQLRGGGRHHKAKEKVVYQDKVGYE